MKISEILRVIFFWAMVLSSTVTHNQLTSYQHEFGKNNVNYKNLTLHFAVRLNRNFAK